MEDSKHASILAIGTANPQNVVYQADFVDEYFRLTGCEDKVDLKSKMKQICEESMIHKRYLGHIFDEIYRGKSNVLAEKYPTIGERFDLDTIAIPQLGAMAATKAINEWGRPKSTITDLVVHSTSGGQIPGFDIQLVKLLGLQPSVRRCPLYHQGTMAGGTTLRIAKDIAENNDGSRVLIVCIEVVLDILHEPSDMNLVVPSILGEGAAALIIGANPNVLVERPLFRLISASQTLIPETEDLFVCKINEKGMTTSVSDLEVIGTTVADHIEKFLVEVVGSTGITDLNKLFWIVHPGGTKVLDIFEEKLNLNQEKLKQSRLILREYGNMSGPTILFVIDGMRKSSLARGLATTGEGLNWGVFIAIGPGLSLEKIVIQSCPLSLSA